MSFDPTLTFRLPLCLIVMRISPPGQDFWVRRRAVLEAKPGGCAPFYFPTIAYFQTSFYMREEGRVATGVYKTHLARARQSFVPKKNKDVERGSITDLIVPNSVARAKGFSWTAENRFMAQAMVYRPAIHQSNRLEGPPPSLDDYDDQGFEGESRAASL